MSGQARYRLGVALLVLSFVCPLGGFVVARLDLPTAVKGTIIGLLAFGVPEVIALAAAAVLGKENFLLIKEQARAWLRSLKPAPVGRAQYYVGLTMMMLPLIPTYIMAYAPAWLPEASPARLYVAIASDVTFVAGLFVAGGDMFDKLKAIFVYDARVEFPSRPERGAGGS